MQKLYDVIIIGGGVVGSAIARELSRYRLKIAVLEKNLDVCFETSGRNTGVCHGGFAYDPGTLKAKLCVEGNRMMRELAQELDFPFKRTGKVLVGNTDEEYEQLGRVMRQGAVNGATGLSMIGEEELHRLVPSVQGRFAMLSRNSGILDPFLMTIALAENAHKNGVEYHFDSEVTGIRRSGNENVWEITTAHGDTYAARWAVNAAGLGCGKISDMLGIKGYKIIGSKDDYIILDQRLGALVPMPIYTVPSNTYMGIHVTITTDGNVLLGPTAEDTDNLSYYGTEQKNLDYLYQEAMKIWPHVKKSDYIRTYSGILPKWVDDNGKIQDFKIEIRDDLAPNAVNLVGIESPGLTASVPIARMVVEIIGRQKPLQEKKDFIEERKGPARLRDLSEAEQAALIAADPEYGEIICRCQKVSKREIRNAIENPFGAKSISAIKYRAWATTGRCNGGYCLTRIVDMLVNEYGVKPEEITYRSEGSELFTGSVK